MIFAIDPGNELSAYVILGDGLRPTRFGKITNEEMIGVIRATFSPSAYEDHRFAIEMIGHYGTGMPAGKTVFDTCVWIGRFVQEYYALQGKEPTFIMRKDEKMNLCGNMKAKDSNIRQALIDRFGVVGTKKNPGWFYGVSKDVWQAIAVGVTYYDMYMKGENKDG